MQKSYFLKNGLYYDTTTKTFYEPKQRCEICGATYPLSVHHYLNQQKCLKDLSAQKVIYPSTWTKEFINENQKLFTLCYQCHKDVETLSEEKFKEKYKQEKEKFIYIKK